MHAACGNVRVCGCVFFFAGLYPWEGDYKSGAQKGKTNAFSTKINVAIYYKKVWSMGNRVLILPRPKTFKPYVLLAV